MPYYFVFSRYTNKLRAWRLISNRYREQVLTNSRFWIPELELAIGLWSGSYQGCQRLWLRWYNANGDLVLNSEEKEQLAIEREQLAVEREQLAVEREQLAVEREQLAIERAERMAERLKAMGINPDDM